MKVPAGYSVPLTRTCPNNVLSRQCPQTANHGWLKKTDVAAMEHQGVSLTVSDYWLVVRKRWGLMVLVTLCAVGAAFLVTRFTTPLYLSTTKIFVSTQASDNPSDLLQGSSFTQQRVKSYSDLVTSPSVLSPVVRELGLRVPHDTLVKRITATVPLNEVIIQIDVLDESRFNAARIANHLAQSLTTKVAEIESPLSGAASPVKLSIVQPGSLAIKPDSPKPLLNYALGLFVGLALSLGLAVLLETLDTRIRSGKDVEGFGTEAILGGITFDPAFTKNPLVVSAHPKSRKAESFRQLRTNIQFVEVAQGSKAIVVSSAVPGDGKTTTIANLALAFADTGKRVIVVDGDFRKPRLHKTMGIEGSVGLTNFLIGQAQLEDVIQPWGTTSLSVLPAGKIPPNPSELLGSEAMANLLQKLEQSFDVVLIDSAPLLPVTDAAILSRMTGGVVMVVSVGKTTKPELRTAVSHLTSVDGKLLGFVMNRIPTKGAQAYQYRYAYKEGYTTGAYGERYDQVYGDDLTPVDAGKRPRRSKKS